MPFITAPNLKLELNSHVFQIWVIFMLDVYIYKQISATYCFHVSYVI